MPHHTIYIGNTLDVLKTLPDESVDCIVTSPPYWGLRDYGEETNTIWDGDPNCEHEFEINRVTKSSFCKKCGAWYGQLGLEPTLDLYIKHMLQITAELKRVLKKTGVMFWNHGDSYFGGHPGGSVHGEICGNRYGDKSMIPQQKEGRPQGSPIYRKMEKCLVMQNYRLILKMIDEQGWILRNIIIWHKPNHMPSSVKDRFTNAYEPVFMLTKNKRYWFDLDAVRVPHKNPKAMKKYYEEEAEKQNKRFRRRETKFQLVPGQGYKNPLERAEKYKTSPKELLGKNPADLWTIPTQPFPEAHFATFPEKLVEPMIKAGCPQWICKKCGKVRERIYSHSTENLSNYIPYEVIKEYNAEPPWKEIGGYIKEKRIQLKMTQKELAQKMKVSTALVRFWELGERGIPVNTMLKLKKILQFDNKFDKWIMNYSERKVPRLPRPETAKYVKGHIFTTSYRHKREFIGWTDCGCNAGWKAGVVLDPFAGSGTTNIVAEKLGRNSIGIELNPKYVEMIKKRFEPYLIQKKLIGSTTLEIKNYINK